MSARGHSPICIACRVSENTPEMSACDAITVAAAASTISGTSAQPGASLKNGLSTACGLASIRAPCPK